MKQLCPIYGSTVTLDFRQYQSQAQHGLEEERGTWDGMNSMNSRIIKHLTDAQRCHILQSVKPTPLILLRIIFHRCAFVTSWSISYVDGINPHPLSLMSSCEKCAPSLIPNSIRNQSKWSNWSNIIPNLPFRSTPTFPEPRLWDNKTVSRFVSEISNSCESRTRISGTSCEPNNEQTYGTLPIRQLRTTGLLAFDLSGLNLQRGLQPGFRNRRAFSKPFHGVEISLWIWYERPCRSHIPRTQVGKPDGFFTRHKTCPFQECWTAAGSMEDTPLYSEDVRHWYVGILVLQLAWSCMKLHAVGIPLCVLCTDSFSSHLTRLCVWAFRRQVVHSIDADSLFPRIPPLRLTRLIVIGFAQRLQADVTSRRVSHLPICRLIYLNHDFSLFMSQIRLFSAFCISFSCHHLSINLICISSRFSPRPKACRRGTKGSERPAMQHVQKILEPWTCLVLGDSAVAMISRFSIGGMPLFRISRIDKFKFWFNLFVITFCW